MNKERKKSLVGWTRINWKLRWTKPRMKNSKPTMVIQPYVSKCETDKRFDWIKEVKVRVTIKEL